MKIGQISVEYLLMFSVLLVFVAISAGYAYLMFTASANDSIMRNNILKIDSAIREVYSLGEGNVKIIEINLPPTFKDAYYDNNIGYFVIDSGDVNRVYSFGEDYNVYGTLPSSYGLRKLYVKSFDFNIEVSVFE